MRTEDKNKLIAEFLGYSTPHPDYLNANYWYKKGQPPLTLLSFDSDWNWLMEAVEVIESKGVTFTIKSVWNPFHKSSFNQVQILKETGKIPEGCRCMTDFVTEYEKNSGTLSSKKQQVFESVIEFIIWYNQNK